MTIEDTQILICDWCGERQIGEPKEYNFGRITRAHWSKQHLSLEETQHTEDVCWQCYLAVDKLKFKIIQVDKK
jgi:hypothetical protein